MWTIPVPNITFLHLKAYLPEAPEPASGSQWLISGKLSFIHNQELLDVFSCIEINCADYILT